MLFIQERREQVKRDNPDIAVTQQQKVNETLGEGQCQMPERYVGFLASVGRRGPYGFFVMWLLFWASPARGIGGRSRGLNKRGFRL